jgi:hypothetical protein
MIAGEWIHGQRNYVEKGTEVTHIPDKLRVVCIVIEHWLSKS